MKITQLISEEERECPYCGEKHGVQEVVVTRTIEQGPMVAQVPGRYLYCANKDVFYEDMICMAFNQQQLAGINVFGGPPPAAAMQ